MKSNKIIVGILTGTLALTSATAVLNNSNFAEAKNSSSVNNSSITKHTSLSNQEIAEGKIISDYIKLQKKNGVYRYNFINDPSLNERLKSINSNLTDKEISQLVAHVNDQLQKENGSGKLTNSIKKIRKEAKFYKYSTHNSSLKNACSNSMFWLTAGNTALYTWAGYLTGAGPAGIAVGITGAVVGLTIGAVGTWEC